MSISIKDLLTKLYFATVPLSLLLACAVAIWFGAIRESQYQKSALRVPSFNYQASSQDYNNQIPVALPDKETASPKLKEPGRNIFGFNTVTKEEEKNLEIMELTLGLIVVKGERRFCLTNGIMLAQGEAGNGFLIHRIEENGVWYKIGESILYLQPGDKISVDSDGNISGPPKTVIDINRENSDLKLNETQAKEWKK